MLYFGGGHSVRVCIRLHHIPEDCNLNDHCYENLDSQNKEGVAQTSDDSYIYRYEGWNSPLLNFPLDLRGFFMHGFYQYKGVSECQHIQYCRTVAFLMKIQILQDVTVSVGKQFGIFWMTVVPSTQCHISDDLYLQPHLYDNLKSYIFNAYNLVVIQFKCMCSTVVSNLEAFILKFMTLIPGNLGFKIHFSCETAHCSTFIL